jgi:hypothetical protein
MRCLVAFLDEWIENCCGHLLGFQVGNYGFDKMKKNEEKK